MFSGVESFSRLYQIRFVEDVLFENADDINIEAQNKEALADQLPL